MRSGRRDCANKDAITRSSWPMRELIEVSETVIGGRSDKNPAMLLAESVKWLRSGLGRQR